MKNETTLPGFNAVASLAKPSRHYNYALAGAAMSEAGVLPSQFEGLDEAASADDGDDMGDDSDDDTED